MSRPSYHLSRIQHSSSTSVASLLPRPAPSKSQPCDRFYGRPKSKRRFSLIDSLAIITSLFCLGIAVAVTTPRLKFVWQLGYSGQLIVIGAMLSILNLCMHRVLPAVLVLIEITKGPSRLQNYDAILSGKIFASHISVLWRLTIILVTILPLGLSVAYKRFLGGAASKHLDSFDGTYGVDFPQIGLYAPKSSPIYLQITSYAPFLAASKNGTAPFPYHELPAAYGYNTLILNSTSAAVLDVPKPSYVQAIQSLLRGNESWTLSAEVEGYLASYDTSSPQLRADDAFWNQNVDSASGGLLAFSLYETDQANIGTMSIAGAAACWISIYLHGHDGGFIVTDNATANDVVLFRKVAQLYRVRRQRFDAQWQVNGSGIALLSGSLAAEPRQFNVSQDVLSWEGQMEPFPPDYMPDLPHVYWPYVADNTSAWLQPSYAATVATIYWSRAVYMLRSALLGAFSYVPRIEHIVSTRNTVRAAPLLYVVLFLQPLISVICLGVIAFFYQKPVSNGFGTVSILARVEKSDLTLLHGAGLSGQLSHPLTLEIVPRTQNDSPVGEGEDQEVIQDAGVPSRVTYRLSTMPRRRRPHEKLSKHTKYW